MSPLEPTADLSSSGNHESERKKELEEELRKKEDQNRILESRLRDLSNEIASLTDRNKVLNDRTKSIIKLLRIQSLKQRIKEIDYRITWNGLGSFFLVSTSVAMVALVFVEIGILKKQTEIIDQQTLRLDTQNSLINSQNQLVKSQNLLSEAERRSAYVFMMGHVMDEINQELSNPYNFYRRLSPSLIGQIVSLSNALTPYSFILGDTLTEKPFSPERGLLLSFILESEINPSDVSAICYKGNFRDSYGEKLYLIHDTLALLDLRGSHFNEIRLVHSQIDLLACAECNFKLLDIEECRLANALFTKADSISAMSVRSSQIIKLLTGATNIGHCQILDSSVDGIFIGAKSQLGEMHIHDSRISNLAIEAESIDLLSISRSHLFGGIEISTNSAICIPTAYFWYVSVHNYWQSNRDLSDAFLQRRYLIDEVVVSNSYIDSIISMATIRTLDISKSTLRCLDWKNPNLTDISLDNSIVDPKMANNLGITSTSCVSLNDSQEYASIFINDPDYELTLKRMGIISEHTKEMKKDWRRKDRLPDQWNFCADIYTATD